MKLIHENIRACSTQNEIGYPSYIEICSGEEYEERDIERYRERWRDIVSKLLSS